MENLGLSPLPNGTVRLFSEYKCKDLEAAPRRVCKTLPALGKRAKIKMT
jgi:hypothetical protein